MAIYTRRQRRVTKVRRQVNAKRVQRLDDDDHDGDGTSPCFFQVSLYSITLECCCFRVWLSLSLRS